MDISGLLRGGSKTVEWCGKPVWIVRRTLQMLAALQDHVKGQSRNYELGHAIEGGVGSLTVQIAMVEVTHVIRKAAREFRSGGIYRRGPIH